MPAHAHANVVEVERVGGCTVCQRGLRCRCSKTVAKYQRFSAAPLLPQHLRDDPGGILSAPGEGHTQRIQNRALRLHSRFLRNRLRRGAGNKFSEPGSGFHGQNIAQLRTNECAPVFNPCPRTPSVVQFTRSTEEAK